MGDGAGGARISPGRGEIATRWLVLLMEALLGNQRGWIRYGGPEARSGAVAQVVSRGQFSQGSVRTSPASGRGGSRVEQRALRGLLCGLTREAGWWWEPGDRLSSWARHLVQERTRSVRLSYRSVVYVLVGAQQQSVCVLQIVEEGGSPGSERIGFSRRLNEMDDMVNRPHRR